MSPRKKTTIYTILNESAVVLLDEQRWVEAREVVLRARRLHPALFAAEQERLIMQAARRIAKEVMKDLSEDDKSSPLVLALLDLALPTAIALPDTDEDGDGFTYIRSDKANWPELLAGGNVRDRNVERAQAKRDAYWESVDVLRPIMEKQPGLTVADAIRILRAGHVA